jgi:DNA-binding beta-propeller fold protein YncE
MRTRTIFLTSLLALLAWLPAAAQAYPGLEATYLGSIGAVGAGPGEFDHPVGVAIAPNGHLWVVDQNNDRVEELGPGGEYLGQIGSAGTGPSQFLRPTAIAFGPEGSFWVVDANNLRLQQFDEEGNFLRTLHPAGEHALANPQGVTVDSAGDVWVADTGHGRVEEFSEEGEFLRVVGSLSGGADDKLYTPTGLMIDPEGKLWVADRYNERVKIFDSAGNPVRDAGRSPREAAFKGNLLCPDAIAVDPAGTVMVVDRAGDRVVEFNLDGEYVTQFGGSGTGPGRFEFGMPGGIAVGKEGDVWIVDGGHDKVQHWRAPDVNDLATYAGSFYGGSGEGKLGRPAGLAIGLDGKIWVTDREKNRVEVFGAGGKYLWQFGSEGSGPGQFNRPEGIRIDSTGNVYVADAGNKRVQKFNWKGEFQRQFGRGQPEWRENLNEQASALATDAAGAVYILNGDRINKFSGTGQFVGWLAKYRVNFASNLDFDPEGHLWVIDGYAPHFKEFDAAGHELRSFGAHGVPGHGVGEFEASTGLDVDPNGYVYVSDGWNGHTQVFNSQGKFVTWFGKAGSGPAEITRGSGTAVAADGKGNVWVADPGARRVMHWVLPSGL